MFKSATLELDQEPEMTIHPQFCGDAEGPFCRQAQILTSAFSRKTSTLLPNARAGTPSAASVTCYGRGRGECEQQAADHGDCAKEQYDLVIESFTRTIG